MEIVCNSEYIEPHEIKDGNSYINVKTREIRYCFALDFLKVKTGFNISNDRLHLEYDLLQLKNKKRNTNEEEKIGEASLTIVNEKGKLTSTIQMPTNIKLKKKDIFPFIQLINDLSPKGLLLETPFFHVPFGVAEIIKNVSIYNFDPNQSKKAIPLTGKTELEEDGSNLALVLKNLLDKKRVRGVFTYFFFIFFRADGAVNNCSSHLHLYLSECFFA